MEADARSHPGASIGGGSVKPKSSYQRANAVRDHYLDAAVNDIREVQGTNVALRDLVRFYLYAAAHRAIVVEMRAAAKARKAAK